MEVTCHDLRLNTGFGYCRPYRLLVPLEIIKLAKVAEAVEEERLVALRERKGAFKVRSAGQYGLFYFKR